MFAVSQTLSPVTTITNELQRTSLSWDADDCCNDTYNSIKKSSSEPPLRYASSCPISRRLVFDYSGLNNNSSSEEESSSSENEWLSLSSSSSPACQSPASSSPMLSRSHSNIHLLGSGLKKAASLSEKGSPKVLSSKRRSKGSAISPRERCLQQENIAPSANATSPKPPIAIKPGRFLLSRSGSGSTLGNRNALTMSQPSLPSLPLSELPQQSSPTTSPSIKKSKVSSKLDDMKEYSTEINHSPTRNFKSPFSPPPPILPTESSSDLGEITADTLRQLCEGGFPQVKRYVIIDARFPYEYKGGHIKNALNIFESEDIDDLFQITGPNTNKSKYGFSFDPHDPANETTAFIFHCEFSSHRGPRMAKQLRALDRFANRACYPKLFYPQVFILKGGYMNFFTSNTEHQKLCDPMAYLPMDHPEFAEDLKLYKRRLQRSTNNILQSMKRPRSMSLGDCLMPTLRSSVSSPNLKPL